MDEVFFTGFGLVSPIGETADAAFDSIVQGVTEPGSVDVALKQEVLSIPYRTVADPSVASGSERMLKIAEKAVRQAIDDAGLTVEQLKSAGLFVGSTSFDMFASENIIKQQALTGDAISEALTFFSVITDSIKETFSIKGPSYTFNTACTSSANALIYAAEFVRQGDIDHAIVLGVEFFNEVTALGFSGLELISKKGMRPFSRDRDGLYLGEGCGAVVLSKEKGDAALYYAGGANIGDNFSITASNPDGSVVEKTIARALDDADIGAADVKLVKVHGTASLSNDEAEAAGLAAVFSAVTPPLVCFKPFIGHTLGACGINELILFAKALGRGFSMERSDIDKDFSLRFAEPADFNVEGYFLLNYFGFGGNSTVLVVGNV